MKIFLRIAAAYFAVTGLMSLLIPQSASGQLGHALSAFDVFVARSLGASIVTVALVNWSFSTFVDRSTLGIMWANLFMNAVLASIDIAAVIHKTIGSSAWLGISVHGILIVGFIYCIYQTYTSKIVKEQV